MRRPVRHTCIVVSESRERTECGKPEGTHSQSPEGQYILTFDLTAPNLQDSKLKLPNFLQKYAFWLWFPWENGLNTPGSLHIKEFNHFVNWEKNVFRFYNVSVISSTKFNQDPQSKTVVWRDETHFRKHFRKHPQPSSEELKYHPHIYWNKATIWLDGPKGGNIKLFVKMESDFQPVTVCKKQPMVFFPSRWFLQLHVHYRWQRLHSKCFCCSVTAAFRKLLRETGQLYTQSDNKTYIRWQSYIWTEDQQLLSSFLSQELTVWATIFHGCWKLKT